MKKMIALFVVVCTAVGIVGCSAKASITVPTTASTTAPTAITTTAPTKMPMHRTYVDLGYEFAKVLECFGTPEESDICLDIPVYYEYDLLFYGEVCFALTKDASRFKTQTLFYEGYEALNVLQYLPTVMRIRADGSSYAVYDTDTGYRLYLFIDPIDIKPTNIIGYPIVIKKDNILSLSDFKDIQIGDPIEKVEAIDDVATLHKRQLEYANFKNSIYYESCAKNGYPVASIHYLKDGILKIEYLMPEHSKLIVSNITFYEHFAMKAADGKVLNYKIKDIDLPVT